MTGIILAGGESRRMGTDKAFLQLEGKPLVDRILSVFLSLFDQTILVTNRPESYQGFRVRVISDAVDIPGPLTGVYTGLLHARSEHSFVAACDMPFLSQHLISYMIDSAGDYDAVVPVVGGLLEPLHAVYHRRTLPVLRDLLGSDDRRISRLFDRVRVRYLTSQEIAYYDPAFRSFTNINTPEQLKEVLCSDSECRNY